MFGMETNTSDSEHVEQLVTWHPVAEMLRLKKRAFWSLLHRKEKPLKFYRLTDRSIRFKMSDVEAWLQSIRVGG